MGTAVSAGKWTGSAFMVAHAAEGGATPSRRAASSAWRIFGEPPAFRSFPSPFAAKRFTFTTNANEGNRERVRERVRVRVRERPTRPTMGERSAVSLEPAKRLQCARQGVFRKDGDETPIGFPICPALASPGAHSASRRHDERCDSPVGGHRVPAQSPALAMHALPWRA